MGELVTADPDAGAEADLRLGAPRKTGAEEDEGEGDREAPGAGSTPPALCG
jgi:hypothetical protein